MATRSYDDPNYDPTAQPDWQAQIRQQILAQQQEPSATTSPTAAAATPSPDFNPTTGTGSPPFATSYGDGTTTPDQGTAPATGAPVFTPGNTFTNTSPTAPSKPSGIPDPKYPGYDTAGYLLNATVTPTGPFGETVTKNPAAPAANPVQTAYGLSNGYATVPAASDPNQAWKDSIRQIISRRLAADQGPVDENSPQIQAALNASKDALTRQNTTERDALAERLYAQGGGLNTNAVTSQIQQSNERTGTAQGTLRAQLLMSAYKDKFTELNHLLDLATQTGDTESARQIQVTLANLQAAVQRENIGANLSEASAQLNQNAALAGLNP